MSLPELFLTLHLDPVVQRHQKSLTLVQVTLRDEGRQSPATARGFDALVLCLRCLMSQLWRKANPPRLSREFLHAPNAPLG